MRTDVDDDALVDWIRGIIVMMILREDLDPDRERAMVRDFFLHSILPQDAQLVDLTEARAQPASGPNARRTAKARR
jgi:hypothetical protein